MANEKKQMTLDEWRQEAVRRFGREPEAWKFICPSCGHVASVRNWKDAGAKEGEVAVSCVGRHLKGSKQMGEKPGPCNYAGYGLLRLNPVAVVCEGGDIVHVFDFAEGDRK